MSNIIQWPDSQTCMDCKHSNWLQSEEEDNIIHPAAVCDLDHNPGDSKCSQYYNKWQDEEVELIASGYEWTCPACDELNSLIETTESVTCKECGRDFKVDSYAHSHS